MYSISRCYNLFFVQRKLDTSHLTKIFYKGFISDLTAYLQQKHPKTNQSLVKQGLKP